MCIRDSKTVEDAVAAVVTGFDGDGLWYSPRRKQWIASPEYMASDSYLVCTREQFKACVAAKIAKAKSEPKWTHCTSLGKCRVLIDIPDEHGYVVIERDGEGYSLVPPRCLKPIKPTITEKERETVAKFVARIYTKDDCDLRKEFDDFISEHEVVE